MYFGPLDLIIVHLIGLIAGYLISTRIFEMRTEKATADDPIETAIIEAIQLNTTDLDK